MSCKDCRHSYQEGTRLFCELNDPPGVYPFEKCDRYQMRSPADIFGKEYVVKVTDDGECITAGTLVRCRDCINLEAGESVLGKWSYCRWTGLRITDTDDYCSWGEDKHENRG